MTWSNRLLSWVFPLSFYLLFDFSHLGCAYDAQYYQGWGNFKGIYAQQLANTCRYTCSMVAPAIEPHRNYVTTVLGALSRVQ